MRVRLLGAVVVVGADQRPIDVGPAKCQALLAALALTPGEAVPVWRLVDLVWGPAAPRTADRTLQSYVTRLRKALGPEAITRVGPAYRFDIPADAIDTARFQRFVDGGDVEAALREWTGPPLAGLDAPGLTTAVDALIERWLGAVEADLERRVQLDPAAAIGTLTELTAAYPFREALWALLMAALYRVGRQADALAAYQTARERLVDELGIEPSPRLRDLESRILGQDERLAPAGDHDDALPTTTGETSASPRAGNLPRQLGRLVGRDAEVELIDAALAADPVVTLVGAGGIGKTRLAIAAAQRTSGEAWLIELAEIGEPTDVPRAVADAIGVTDSPGRTLTESVVTALRSRPALLILDNCEHVIAAAAALARAVAEHCPRTHVLATSREPLAVGGERLVEIKPLDATAGSELFGERARAVSSTFDPVESREAVEDICRRLDGIPLAIELAAARTRTLSPAELSARLVDRLRLLSGRRTGAERHRTLTASIAWSHDLLTRQEQQLFARLSVFAGPFGLSAAEAVAAHPDVDVDVDVGLGDLVDRSMLLVEPGRFGRRFRWLEPMREFAAERLEDAGEAEEGADRHARWSRDAVARIGALLAGREEIEGVARLGELWPNLRAAFDRACRLGDHVLARALVRPVVAEVLLRSRQEIGDWTERLLAIAPPDDRDTTIFALAWAAQRYAVAHDAEGYIALAERHGEPDHPLVHHARAAACEDWAAMLEWAPQAVRAHRAHGDDDLAEHAEIDAGAALLNLGRLDEHDAVVGALADRYRVHGPPTLHNWALMLLGYSATFQGQQERAEQLFEEAVAVGVPERTHSPNKAIEARIAFRRGNRPRAFRILGSHLDELLLTDNMQGASIAAVEFVNMMVTLDRIDDARRLLAYLQTTGLLDAPPFRTLVENATCAVAATAEGADDERVLLDDRQALETMRRILRGLDGEPDVGGG